MLIATFGVMLLFGLPTSALDSSKLLFAPDNSYSVTALIGNLLGLQNILVPEFGGNFPLWSLSNETYYYVLFPLLVMLLARGRCCTAS